MVSINGAGRNSPPTNLFFPFLLAILLTLIWLAGGSDLGSGRNLFITGDAPPPLNLSISLPIGVNSVNFSCFQAYMNNSPPNGQDAYTPIFNITNANAADYTNITLALNQSLPAGFVIYAQTANYVNPSSINLTTSGQVVIKRLLANQSKGIWMFGYCNNVSDNQTMNFNFTFGGGS